MKKTLFFKNFIYLIGVFLSLPSIASEKRLRDSDFPLPIEANLSKRSRLSPEDTSYTFNFEGLTAEPFKNLSLRLDIKSLVFLRRTSRQFSRENTFLAKRILENIQHLFRLNPPKFSLELTNEKKTKEDIRRLEQLNQDSACPPIIQLSINPFHSTPEQLSQIPAEIFFKVKKADFYGREESGITLEQINTIFVRGNLRNLTCLNLQYICFPKDKETLNQFISFLDQSNITDFTLDRCKTYSSHLKNDSFSLDIFHKGNFLSQLNSLTIFFSNISAKNLGSLKNCLSLKQLTLIPPTSLAEINHLSNIWINELPLLQSLSLCFPVFLPESLSSFEVFNDSCKSKETLTNLNVTVYKISKNFIDSLKNFKNLTSLNLHSVSTQLSNFDEKTFQIFREFPHLETLGIKTNILPYSLKELEKLPSSVKHLTLRIDKDDTKYEKIETVSSLFLPTLQTLDLIISFQELFETPHSKEVFKLLVNPSGMKDLRKMRLRSTQGFSKKTQEFLKREKKQEFELEYITEIS